MTAEEQVICTAYEDEDMLPEQIAESQDLEVLAVKSCLMQHSSLYRKACGQEPKNLSRLNYSEDEQYRVKEMMLSLALGAEDEHLRGKMCLNIRDDGMGRKDIVKAVKESGVNVFNINLQIQKARQATARLINGSANQKAINV